MIKYYFINKKKMLIIGFVIGLNLLIFSYYNWALLSASLLKTQSYFFGKQACQLYLKFKQNFFNNKNFFNAEKNIYSVLSKIEEAKILVEKNDILNAEKALLKALTLTNKKNLQNLINIKLARIQLALNHTEEALLYLMEVDEKSWNIIVENIRGDIFLKKNNVPAARAAYLKGLESDGSENMKTILKMKINSLL
ncbi:MAG: tetratricopeptide repeat protein [Arsenophonus sp.]|nr:MAG: tetratricopeptide repeat protein [Arsenophonus sp.]